MFSKKDRRTNGTYIIRVIKLLEHAMKVKEYAFERFGGKLRLMICIICSYDCSQGRNNRCCLYYEADA